MKRVLARHRRDRHIFEGYINQSILYEDVLEAQKRGDGKLRSPLVNSRWSWWYLTARQPVMRTLSVLVGTCSIILLISETQVFLTP